jgi:hypothetical protein
LWAASGRGTVIVAGRSTRSLGVIARMGTSRKEIERAAESLASWEHGLARLGECVAHFQRIDEALNICISALIGSDRKVGEIVASEMSFRAKISVYSALCHNALRVEKLPQDLIELVSRLHWAEQERNALSHSLWDASEDNPGTIRREKTSSKRGKLTVVEENLTPEDLEELGKLFEGVATDLFYLTGKHIPKIEAKLR